MHNNEFEKRVELRLEELSFSPSDAVWQKVEQQVRQRRRRRVLFWWLPLSLLCIGVAGWFLFHSNSSVSEQHQQAVVNEYQLNTYNSSAQSVTSVNKEQVVAEEKNGTTEKQAAIETKEKKTSETVKNDKTVVPVVNVQLQLPGVIIPKQEPNIAHQNQKKETIVAEVVKESNVSMNDPLIETKRQEPKLEILVTKDDELVKENEIVNDYQQQKIIADSSTPVANAKPADQKLSFVKKKKVEWFAKIGAGISGMSQFSTQPFSPLALSENKNYVADSYYVPTSAAGSGGNSYRPSSIKKGVGFTAGMEVRTIAKKRSSFSAGLNYGFYSTSIKTGSTVDSVASFYTNNYNSLVRNYMRAGSINQFVNQYHYIELPLLYHYRLTKQTKHPFYLNSGVSYNYLLASNANYYASQSGDYYYDKKLFNRSQYYFKLGASTSFLKRKNYPLQVGLLYQFGMNGEWKKSVKLNQHLTYTGIEFLWRLHQ